MEGLKKFTQISIDFIEHSIKANQREDKLYHAYNLMSSTEDEVSISHLSEMLEGQVAAISSGFLDAKETLEILNSLRNSALYRQDQNSYILYPNKELPKFLEKNILPKDKVQHSLLLNKLLQNQNFTILNQDIKGDYHFNGNFHNANDLKAALEQLKSNEDYKILVEKEATIILQIFEEVFNHKAFTGRSGTFYGYEGLGSIYWHMVSKLHVAVQEVCIKAISDNEDTAIINGLLSHYQEIGKGIGVHKSPSVYGAFPTDPYSHTPMYRKAQQPGMTGQVKEDILTRIGELGVKVNDGKLQFQPTILDKNEFLTQSQEVVFINVEGSKNNILLEKDSLAFTYCQVPIIYIKSTTNQMELFYKNGTIQTIDSLELDEDNSHKIFKRTAEIVKIIVSIKESLVS
jgi:hypothetical protein